MDNIRPLAGRVKKQTPVTAPEITWKTYEDAIYNENILGQVQVSMDRNFSRTSVQRFRAVVSEPAAVSFAFGSNDGGELLTISRKSDHIITSAKFPEYLHSQGLSEEQALNLAASSVLAYSCLFKVFSALDTSQRATFSREVKRSYMKLTVPQVWSQDAYWSGTAEQTPHTIIHRIAGLVALGAGELQPLVLQSEAALPLHVAALVDPLASKHAGLLHDIVIG